LVDGRSRAAVEFAERMADSPQDSNTRDKVLEAACAASEKLEELCTPGPDEAEHEARWAAAELADRLPVDPIQANIHRIAYGASQLACNVCQLLHDIFGNPFRPVAFDPAWRTDTAVALARQMYESRDFGAMPILADALQDAGCDSADVLDHCRGLGPHVRGCWVVDLVLGKS
jgi:hypothetical protein